MADSETEAQLRLRLSAMDMKSEVLPVEQNTATATATATAELKDQGNGASDNLSDAKDVFYDDDGLVLDNLGFESVILVDNLPILGHERARKLEADVREIFGSVGAIKSEGFSMPVNLRSLQTLGYCFIEFNTRKEAERAIKSINGYRYDNYRLSVTFYEDLHKPEQTISDFEPYIHEKTKDDGSESEDDEE